MSQKTILIVEDAKDLVAVLATRCEKMGLNVRMAYDVPDALQSLDEQLPDLICLDVNLPSGNGLDVREALANDPRTNEIPVIVLTGCKDHETIRRCGDLRVKYVHKPGMLWQRIEPLIDELIGVDADCAALMA